MITRDETTATKNEGDEAFLDEDLPPGNEKHLDEQGKQEVTLA